MILGGVDKSLYEGSIQWINIQRLETLSAEAGSINLGGKVLYTK